MDIFIGKKKLEFKYGYLLVFFILLFNNDVIFDIVFTTPTETSTQPEGPGIANTLHKILTGAAILLTFINFNQLHKALKFWIVVCSIYIFYLVLESFYNYSTPLIYPHVISKITPIFFVSMTYPYFIEGNRDKKLKHVTFLFGFFFIICALVSKRDAFSFDAFMNTERGFSASTLYFVLFCTILYFNIFMKKISFTFLFLFLISLGLVIFFQHRTVWFSGICAFMINLNILYLKTKSGIKYSSTSFLILSFITISILAFAFVFSYNPELIEKFSDRFGEVQEYETEGTAGWRYQQVQSYLPFVQDNLLFGMRYEGFELPIQFYHEEANMAYFNDGTGHHIHNFYIHTMFYHGLLGISILVIPILYILHEYLQKRNLSIQQSALFAFAVSGLIYGIAYDITTLYYGTLGISYAYLKNIPESDALIQNQKSKFENA